MARIEFMLVKFKAPDPHSTALSGACSGNGNLPHGLPRQSNRIVLIQRTHPPIPLRMALVYCEYRLPTMSTGSPQASVQQLSHARLCHLIGEYGLHHSAHVRWDVVASEEALIHVHVEHSVEGTKINNESNWVRTQYRTCASRHPKDLEVIPRPKLLDIVLVTNRV